MAKRRRSFRHRTERRPPPILRLGLFLELPFDAGLPDGAVFTLEDDAPLALEGLNAQTSFLVNRAKLEAPWGEALGRAFPWIAPDELRSMPYSRSVVQITRIDAGPADDGWVSDRFDAALAQLNDFLVLLGQAAQEPLIRPVDRLELPAAVPYLLSDLLANPKGEVRAEDRGLLVLHHGVPFVAPAIAQPRLDHAIRLLAVHHNEGHPFFAFGEALLAARTAFAHGRTRQAALDGGTAVEVLVNALLREVAPLRGYTPEKTAKVIGSLGLKNQLREHVGPLLRTQVALDDPADPFGRWTQGAYALRNRVSHEGHRPTHEEVAAALEDVRTLVQALAAALNADELTRPIGDTLTSELP